MRCSMIMIGLTFMAAPALAAGSFAGTWISELSSGQATAPPEVYLLKDGSFSCSTCTPAYTTMADGRFHAVPSNGFRDGIRIAVVDPHTVQMTYSLGGKEIGRNTTTISPDGTTFSYSFERTNLVSGKSFSGNGVAHRVGSAPAGAHAMSGSWQFGPAAQMTPDARTFTIKLDGDAVTMTSGTGETYTARFGGPEVTQTNDTSQTRASVTRPAADTIVERDTRQGQLTDIVTYTLMPDGQSIKVVDDDKLHDSTFTIMARRQ